MKTKVLTVEEMTAEQIAVCAFVDKLYNEGRCSIEEARDLFAKVGIMVREN